MSGNRTIITTNLDELGLTPRDLAWLFCQMLNDEQAEFFAAIKPIADKWPGAGWCQQSWSIATASNEDAHFVVTTLAAHYAPEFNEG